jgi:hypothetical protein
MWSGEKGWLRVQKWAKHPDPATFPQLYLHVRTDSTGRVNPTWRVVPYLPRKIAYERGIKNRLLHHAPKPIGKPPPEIPDEVGDSEPEREALRHWPKKPLWVEDEATKWKPTLFWADLVEEEAIAREKAYEVDERGD